MPPTTRSTKKQAKNKKRHKQAKGSASVLAVGATDANVEHAGQEHLDDFVKQITKLAPWDVWAAKLAAQARSCSHAQADA